MINKFKANVITRTNLKRTRPPSIPPLFLSSFSPSLFIEYQLHDKSSVNEKTDMLLAFMKLTFSGERREGGIWGQGRGGAAFF